MKTLRNFLLGCLMTATLTTSWSQGRVGVGNVYPGKVEYAVFTLGNDEKVKISGRGGAYREEWREIVYYGWIIDSETRQVVWHVSDDIDKPDFNHGDFDINATVSLKKGIYEVYFTTAYNPRNNTWGFNAVGNFFEEKHDPEMQKGMGMEVSAPSLTKGNPVAVMEKKLSDAIVSIQKPGNDVQIKKGFSLTAPTSIRIYAIGEGNRDDTYDYAWITDVDSHKRVWIMDYGNSEFAGGAEKNLVVNERITLPAGNYMVNYATDDSHAYNSWNALPPHDPLFTGVTVWPATEADKKSIVAYRAPEESKPVLELTRIGDNESVSKGLSVKAAGEFRILCLGESGGNDLADYGWITNANTGEVVWDMTEVRTEHAGGDSKNRMVDATIHLEKGDYIVHYATDDSHSYGDWNAQPPHERESYGISLWATNKNDLAKVATFAPKEFRNDKVIIEIVRVHDNENLSEMFTLDKDTNLRIFALGEGSDGDMVDYGWIKNMDTGKVVWEMTYRNTDPAGGASKNRMFNDTIILPKGSYKVYYETDGSHSYRHWNASPPRDQERYGISLTKEIN